MLCVEIYMLYVRIKYFLKNDKIVHLSNSMSENRDRNLTSLSKKKSAKM